MEGDDAIDLRPTRRDRYRLRRQEHRWFATAGARHCHARSRRYAHGVGLRLRQAEAKQYARSRGRHELHADQPQQLDVNLLREPVHAVDQQAGDVGEDFQQHCTRITRRQVGPTAVRARDERLRLREQLPEVAVVEVRRGDRHGMASRSQWGVSSARSTSTTRFSIREPARSRYCRSTSSRVGRSMLRLASSRSTSMRGSQRSIAWRT